MKNSPDRGITLNVLVLRGGGGHYATYLALRSVIEQLQLPWSLDITFVDSLGGEADNQQTAHALSQWLGTSSDRFYDLILKNGWNWIHLLTIHLHKLIVHFKSAIDTRLLEEQWREQPPDMILSVVPFHNKILWNSIQRVKPDTPVVTILTDFADCPPAYWIEPKTQNYLICGTERAAAQARTRGVAEDRIFTASGLVVHPRFYQPLVRNGADQTTVRHLERQRLGLDPNRLTGLVLFGANGSKAMLDIAKRLERFQNLQLIFLCGRNQEVAEILQGHQRCNWLVVGFTDEIPYYMHLADFFIGKPGNISVSEALVMNLPLIVERNLLTLPQERYAADWIQEQEVGLVIPSFRYIQKAVEQFLEPTTFARYRANAVAVNNQAVFEIPHILSAILNAQPPIAHSPRPELMEQNP